MNQLLISIQKQWCSPKGNCTNNPWGPWRTIESFHETADPLNVDSTPRFSPTHLPHLLPPDPAPSGVVTAASRQEGTCGAGPLRNQLCFSGALEGITVKWKKHGKKHMVACRGLSFRFQDLSLSWFTWLHGFWDLWHWATQYFFSATQLTDRCHSRFKARHQQRIPGKLETLNRTKTINPWMCLSQRNIYSTRNTTL